MSKGNSNLEDWYEKVLGKESQKSVSSFDCSVLNLPGNLSSFSSSLISASTLAGFLPDEPRTTLSNSSSISCNL